MPVAFNIILTDASVECLQRWHYRTRGHTKKALRVYLHKLDRSAGAVCVISDPVVAMSAERPSPVFTRFFCVVAGSQGYNRVTFAKRISQGIYLLAPTPEQVCARVCWFVSSKLIHNPNTEHHACANATRGQSQQARGG